MACASRGAHTPVVSDAVHTGAAEGAWGGSALVDIDSAVWAGEAWRALTHSPVDSVDAAAAIVAGMWSTVINVIVAGGAVPPVWTQAGEPVARVDARRTVLARRGVARPTLT